MKLIYQDQDIIVCIKPPRVLSTDEPGGVPSLVREALKDPEADVRTVHRLDRVVSGLMVLARNAKAASELSRQIREDRFEKEYLAIVHGVPEKAETISPSTDAPKVNRKIEIKYSSNGWTMIPSLKSSPKNPKQMQTAKMITLCTKHSTACHRIWAQT